MNKLQEILKNEIVVADGAAGTYISSLVGRNASPCEALNLSDPETVLRMHTQYVKAGARLILTNTFGASMAGGSIGGPFDTTRKIIIEGVNLARKAAAEKAFVAADIGPLPETRLDSDTVYEEYTRIVDTFINAGVNIFVFETFASSKYPILISKYIRSRLADAFILISFAVTPDGYSSVGFDGRRLIDDVKNAGVADAAGFNCCSGPAHLLNYASTIDYGNLIPSIMPNAGYPKRESDDAVPNGFDLAYSGSPEYFASKLSAAAERGFRIIGGCCGTTPRHIALLAKAVAEGKSGGAKVRETLKKEPQKQIKSNTFISALKNPARKAVVVELEPPLNADISKIVASARLLKGLGVDAVTVADSPMARARADSIVVASHLRRETGVEVIPHLCCRDKNINAIKASLIAAHIENIRNILAVTGDPVADSGSVKGVFNLNSEGLCRFIKSLNEDIFSGDPMFCGCAFNANARNMEVELNRLQKKLDAGASFVLTQPVLTPQAAEAVGKARRLGAPILAGIITPISYKNAFFLANEMPGFKIPDEYLKKFSPDMTREQGEKIGIEISIQSAKMVAENTDGFYFIVPFNRVYVTKKVIEALRADGII